MRPRFGLGGGQMNIGGAGVRAVSESIQSAQSLRERADAARLRDQVFRVDVSPDLQGLRRDHDQMALAAELGGPSRGHAVLSVEDADAHPFGLPFA